MFHMKQKTNHIETQNIKNELFHMKQFSFLSQNTIHKLQIYEKMLKKWQNSINLISKNTIPFIWQRHFLDSAQLYPFIPSSARNLVDLGSGAGFPGLVLSIIDHDPFNRDSRKPTSDQRTPLTIHLVESDSRKALFLKEIIRVLSLENIKVLNDRIEDLPPFDADVLTARALAPLPKLLEWSLPFMSLESICLFLKGNHVHEEIASLTEKFDISFLNSLTSQNSFILHIQRKRRSL